MRIDNNPALNRVSRVRLRSVLPTEEASGAGIDSVEVSSRAADVRAAMDALSAAPEIRTERVADLTRQLEQGTLTQDGDALAQKLLSPPGKGA